MNIYVLHENPILCARYHCDRHVTEMVNEYSEILSSAKRLADGEPGTIMRPSSRLYAQRYMWVLEDEEGKTPVIPLVTQIHHPCVEWAKLTSGNYEWLYALYVALCREYAFRRQEGHGASRYIPFLAEPPRCVESAPRTEWLVPIAEIRERYVKDGERIARWELRRRAPEWWPSAAKKSAQVTTTARGLRNGSRQLTLI